MEWCVDEEEATFKVMAATNGWIGIVFSTDSSMVACCACIYIYIYIYIYLHIPIIKLILLSL